MTDATRNNYVLEGPKVLKTITLVLASILFIVSLFYMSLLKVAILFPLFFFGLPLVTIQFHRMTITSSELIVEKYGLVRLVNTKSVYLINEMENIEFARGTPVPHAYVYQTIFRSYGYGPRSRADKLILHFRNGEQKFINRVGSRRDFLSLCEFLDKRV